MPGSTDSSECRATPKIIIEIHLKIAQSDVLRVQNFRQGFALQIAQQLPDLFSFGIINETNIPPFCRGREIFSRFGRQLHKVLGQAYDPISRHFSQLRKKGEVKRGDVLQYLNRNLSEGSNCVLDQGIKVGLQILQQYYAELNVQLLEFLIYKSIEISVVFKIRFYILRVVEPFISRFFVKPGKKFRDPGGGPTFAGGIEEPDKNINRVNTVYETNLKKRLITFHVP